MTTQQKQQWQAELERMQRQAERDWINGKKEDWRLAQKIKLAKSKLGIK